jgi:hypothetical protein
MGCFARQRGSESLPFALLLVLLLAGSVLLVVCS